jgi:hypothetical protein
MYKKKSEDNAKNVEQRKTRNHCLFTKTPPNRLQLVKRLKNCHQVHQAPQAPQQN